MLATEPSKPMKLIYDEWGYYFGHSDDRLKEELRCIDGVPNATYMKIGNDIFVFEKLVEDVKAYRGENPDAELKSFAPMLIERATVSVEEAVRSWRVTHIDFIAEDAECGYHVWHRQFHARLPQDYHTK